MIYEMVNNYSNTVKADALLISFNVMHIVSKLKNENIIFFFLAWSEAFIEIIFKILLFITCKVFFLIILNEILKPQIFLIFFSD